jgi:hypothetical protein
MSDFVFSRLLQIDDSRHAMQGVNQRKCSSPDFESS